MALAVDYHGQPSGRVRAVPDRRAIRCTSTIGLIDRPVAHRGRTALYGPRHLLQLVAVKRLQARGCPRGHPAGTGRRHRQPARPGRPPPLGRPAHGAPRARSGCRRSRRRRPADGEGGGQAGCGGHATLGGSGAAASRRPPAGRRHRAAGQLLARPAGRGLHRPGRRGRHPRCGSRGRRGSPGPVSARLPRCRVCGSGPGPPCCWSRGGSWPRPTSAILAAAGPLLAVLRDRGLDGRARTPDEDADRIPDPLADHEARPARRAENEPRREHP